MKSNVFLKTRDKANESRYRKILELEELFVGSSSSHQFSFNSNDDSRSYEIDSNDLDIGKRIHFHKPNNKLIRRT